jgi:hypothetical protein
VDRTPGKREDHGDEFVQKNCLICQKDEQIDQEIGL